MEIRSVTKAITLLEELAKEPGKFGVIELARSVDMDKSSVSRMLRTLELAGLVTQDSATQRYMLGVALAVLGQKVLRHLNIRELARPVIENLSAVTGEGTHLAILANDRAFYIEQAAPSHGVSVDSPIGTLAPLHCTALGKVLLAYQPTERRTSLIDGLTLDVFTRRTITNREQLIDHIDTVNRTGLGFDDEEFSVGVRCMAAPVFNHEGKICGSIGISGPSPRVTDEKIKSWGDLIRQEAAELSRKMGYQPTKLEH